MAPWTPRFPHAAMSIADAKGAKKTRAMQNAPIAASRFACAAPLQRASNPSNKRITNFVSLDSLQVRAAALALGLPRGERVLGAQRPAALHALPESGALAGLAFFSLEIAIDDLLLGSHVNRPEIMQTKTVFKPGEKAHGLRIG